MKTYRERFLRTHHLAVPLIALFSGCAYFNTFYNATQFFRQAEQDIVTTTETELTDNTTELLNKTVARCNIVLSEYPESKFRDDALLLRRNSAGGDGTVPQLAWRR